jgi:membrane protein YdbS with pleckstrin-like domain
MTEELVSPNMWQSKPWWCQPWTIILTGIIIITSSWLIFHTLWLTVPVAALIVLWWTYFLIIVPRLLMEMRANSERDISKR